MPFGQSCMCLDPMLIVFSFLRNQWLFFIHTWLWKILVILQNKSGLKKTYILSLIYIKCNFFQSDLWLRMGWNKISFSSFPPFLLCSISFRLCLIFRVRKSCVTYLIGQREKCHNRAEIGLWWHWTRGLDETPCHRGNRKLMKSHHMERWCLCLYRTRLQPSRPICSSPWTLLDKNTIWKKCKGKTVACGNIYKVVKASHYFSNETRIKHTTLPLLTQ